VRPKIKNIPTGDIEILVTELNILNASLTLLLLLTGDGWWRRYPNEIPLPRHSKKSVKNSLLFVIK
jgi:hypothetical protein